ncbi:hypothetical protein J6590_027118 [Homalodisca vitripennis]|nr:hypothetical protein J6590_027118 [Homalodisca vitripennis]
MDIGASSATHAAPDADNLKKFFSAGVDEMSRSIWLTNISATDFIQTQSCTNRELQVEGSQPNACPDRLASTWTGLTKDLDNRNAAALRNSHAPVIWELHHLQTSCKKRITDFFQIDCNW